MTIVETRAVTGGVDTHADMHVAAALDPIGGLLGVEEFPVSPAGYARLLGWLGGFGTVALVGIEGTGSYGAGLARHITAAGIRVVEVDRSDRQDRRRQGKSDPLDAVSAARAAQSGRARGAPKGRDGAVEAIRVLMVAKRSARWLWGAFEQLRAAWAATVPADPVQQIDTSAIPVKHPSRVRGPDGWTGPGNDLAARFGRDGAHAEWFYGFRLAIRTDLGRRIVRAWSIVPAAADERQIGTDLVTGDAAAIDALLLDKGFTGRRFAAEMASAGIDVLIPPARAQRTTMPKPLQRLIARLRNRVETSFREITDQMELARHGAHTFEGLLTRTAAVLAAHTLLLTELGNTM
jgi:Transposase/Transposase DDE domain